MAADPTRSSYSRRSSDVLACLVNIYGSKTLFVNEFHAMSRTSWLRLRPAGSPEASLSARARLRLPRAPASLGQSAGWSAQAGFAPIGLDFGMGTSCARATSDAKSGRWTGVSHRHVLMAECCGGCGSAGEMSSISAISAAEAKPSTTPRTHAPKHLLG